MDEQDVNAVTEETVDMDVIDIPDIPLPIATEDTERIEDTFEAGFKIAVIGAGQGGSRIAETFWKMGYRRVCVLNTAIQDLDGINLPDERKMLIGSGGAGKEPAIATQLVDEHREDIYDFMRRSFGTGYDRILITAGAGGGTGAGAAERLVEIAHDVLQSLRIEEEKETKVGVILALPKHSESRKTFANACGLLGRLYQATKPGADNQISPLILIDNERIHQIYPRLSVEQFWGMANKSTCALFHLFNTICIKPSSYASFDTKDYETILNSGVVTLGAVPIIKWDTETDISHAVRDNLKKNILVSDLDLAEANVAGCIFIAGKSILTNIPEAYLDHGFEMLTRMMKAGESTVHRGIYAGRADSLVVYTIMGGLGAPEAKLAELYRLARLQDWDEVGLAPKRKKKGKK